MQRPLAALIGLVLTVSACGDRGSAPEGTPSGEGGLLSIFSSDEPETAPAPIMAEISALAVEPMPGGVIVRATGLPATQGYWDAALVADPPGRDPDVVSFRFTARPPPAPMPAGGAWSREITAAAYLSDSDLEGVRQIVVRAAANQRASRR